MIHRADFLNVERAVAQTFAVEDEQIMEDAVKSAVADERQARVYVDPSLGTVGVRGAF